MTTHRNDDASNAATELLTRAVEGARARGDVDSARPDQIFAELACDWAFIVRIDVDGEWEREWIGGRVPGMPHLELGSIDPTPWTDYILPEDREIAARHFERTLRRGSDRTEFRLVLDDAAPFWIESAMRCMATSDDALRIYCTMAWVDDRRATEEALRARESDYRALVEQASDGILVFGADGSILTSNGAALELFAMTEAQLHAAHVVDLFHPDDLDADPLTLDNLASGMTLRSVRRLKRRGQNGWVWAELSARRLRDGRIQATARDITERIEAERRIRHLAYYDALTSLPNRELFREQIDVALDRAKRTRNILALLFLDVDRFKQVNDSLGHSMGDELLTQIADRLRSAVRGSDSVGRGTADGEREGAESNRESAVSRLGGDEFTILLQDLEHAQDAARVARRVLHLLSRPFLIGDREIFVGASVGIAVWPDDGACAEVLLRSADVAMYHAKGQGGNGYAYFNATMNAASSRRLTLESDLRHALERDELSVEYQPMRNVRSGRVSAAEALLRWTKADGTRIGPDEFIPIAEETGLIVQMGEWVLRRACAQAVAWRDAGFGPIRISVNVSVDQLREVGFVNVVEQALIDTGLSADQLELEITESSILDESPHIVAAIAALTELGIAFALDDFGTGYSSLSALQRFPIERLKIDRSFVAGIGDSESDEALTSAIVALARRLDQRVVAEGVETEEQARVLTQLGCDELQGYLFSRPLAPDAFVAFLEAEKAE